jgi:hypothetical protein
MKSPNVGEYGIAFDLNLNYDLSAATSLQIAITRPDGTKITGTPTVGQVDLATPDQGIFPARQYCTYLFAQGDLNQVGTYSARVTYTDSTKRLTSPPVGFTVDP